MYYVILLSKQFNRCTMGSLSVLPARAFSPSVNNDRNSLVFSCMVKKCLWLHVRRIVFTTWGIRNPLPHIWQWINSCKLHTKTFCHCKQAKYTPSNLVCVFLLRGNISSICSLFYSLAQTEFYHYFTCNVNFIIYRRKPACSMLYRGLFVINNHALA